MLLTFWEDQWIGILIDIFPKQKITWIFLNTYFWKKNQGLWQKYDVEKTQLISVVDYITFY